MEKKKVLAINLGWEQEPLLDKLSEYNIDLYGVHYNDNYYKKINYKGLLITDIRDIHLILDFADKIKPDAVISDQCDYSNFVQSLISEKHNLPGPRTEAAQVSSNKLIQRNVAQKTGVLIPAFSEVRTINDVEQFAEIHKFPIIIKPADNRGSFGVTKIENTGQISPAFYSAIINSHSRIMVVEKFIDGFEITVDGYCFNKKPVSLSLAKKGKPNDKLQVSVDIKYPGELDSALYDKAIKNNEFVNLSLGYNFGMTHSEYIVTPKGELYLVESANRGGGVFTSEIIVPSVSGVDILTKYVEDCLGIENKILPIIIEKNDVILKFFTFKSGQIKKIHGLEAFGDPSVLKARLAVSEGDTINPISNDANRHGFVIVSDKNVRKKAESIINSISIEYY